MPKLQQQCYKKDRQAFQQLTLEHFVESIPNEMMK